MPGTYYGLVRKIGPYKETPLDRQHLNEKQPLFVGGGVWAGGSTHAGHGEWLMVNDIHGNYEGKQQLGFKETSDFATPSVVVPRRLDILATLSPDQRRDYYHEGFFQKQPPQAPVPDMPIEAPADASVNPIVLPAVPGSVVQRQPPSLPELEMESAPSLPDPTFMDLDFDELGQPGPSRPQTSEQGTMTQLPETVRPDTVMMATSATQMQVPEEPESFFRQGFGPSVSAQPPALTWTSFQTTHDKLVKKQAEKEVAQLQTNLKRKRVPKPRQPRKMARVAEPVAEPLTETVMKKPSRKGKEKAQPEPEKAMTVSRKGKEKATPAPGPSPQLQKAGLRKKVSSKTRQIKTAETRLAKLENTQGRTTAEKKRVDAQKAKLKTKIAKLKQEKDLLLSQLNKL